MRCSLFRLTLSLVVAGFALAARAAQAPAGFTALFNGKDLTGWRGGDTFDHRQLLAMSESDRAAKIAEWTKSLTEPGKDGKPHWYAENDVLVNDGFGRYATTEKDYGDFELLLEFKLAPAADSGVYLRGAPQVQIWDSTMPDPKGYGYAKGSGGLWNNPKGSPGQEPLVKADKPIGEWNKLRVVMVGSRTSVWLNEKLVVDHAILENNYYCTQQKLPREKWLPIPARGPIELQTHGGGTSWRNIYLREIGSDEANTLLASRGGAGFQKIFDGKTLDGWAIEPAGVVKTPADVMDIKDGTLVWRAGRGGTPYWKHELTDFQARLLIKIPPGGNNGLAIRYPGKGNTAYDGMTEVQIIDENYYAARKQPDKTLDPRQQFGSIYGMVPGIPGYQHPIGDWNFEEVTVKGSTIKVELNGTVIMDADVSKVDMANVMDHKEHPGRLRTSGYFGFAGHTDPVQFKDISIKQL